MVTSEFIQIVEARTTDPDALIALDSQWEQATKNLGLCAVFASVTVIDRHGMKMAPSNLWMAGTALGRKPAGGLPGGPHAPTMCAIGFLRSGFDIIELKVGPDSF